MHADSVIFCPTAGGTIALIVALAAPLLIAATALSVDVGFWYQQQDTLQTAADAAALAAANAANYGVTSESSVEPLALAAANMASDNQFGLTSA
jgi:Flp pilus assembly protein TadG